MSDLATGGPTVGGHDETPDRNVVSAGQIDRWCEVARSTLAGEGVGDGHLDLLFVDEPSMAELNQQHLGHDGPTDVLSFPIDGPDPAASGPRHLGDVVICPTVAARQAPTHCGNVDAEFTLLIVHGVLHVLGHDHAEVDEALAMQAHERRHLARYGVEHPVPI